MQEIRWHGRGGNGAFTAAKLLGHAVSIHEGKYAQAFPSFGPERRGAPVLAFTRISAEPITDHSQIYSCDCIVVLDETLCDVVDVANGLKDDGVLLLNTQLSQEAARARYKFEGVKNLVVLDATKIALDVLGSAIVNTVMLGAAARAAGLVSLASVESAVDEMMGPALREKNKKAIEMAYSMVEGGAQV